VITEVLQKKRKKEKTSPDVYTLVCFPIPSTMPHLRKKNVWT